MKISVLILLVAAFLLPLSANAADPGIGWIPTWRQATEEARQTSKPILLVAGAPSCGGVPGVW